METKDVVAAMNSSSIVEPTISSTSIVGESNTKNPTKQEEAITRTTMQQASSKTITNPVEVSSSSSTPATKKLITPTEKSRMLVPKQVSTSSTTTRAAKTLSTAANSTPLAVSKIKRVATIESNKPINGSKNPTTSTTADSSSVNKSTPRKPITKIAATIRPTKTTEPAISKQGNYDRTFFSSTSHVRNEICELFLSYKNRLML